MRNIGIPRRQPVRDTYKSPSPWPIILASALPFAVAIVGVILLTVMARAAEPVEARCQQLRDMATAWAGVVLTPSQKVTRDGLVRWYKANCRKHRRDVPL